jgi:HD superfamily phosphohydrolase YqeK
MKKQELEKIKTWLMAFIRNFDSDDEFVSTNLTYKEVHSFEVAKICWLIAESLHVTEEEVLLAETIGLLHDTGRFPQFVRYKTYRDSISENHAMLGVKVLKEAEILDTLSRREKDIILTAILYHNSFILPELPKSHDLFSRIIRDADKLDIFRFILESEGKRITGELQKTIHLELDDFPTCSDAMAESILNNQCCLYRDLKTAHDFKMLQLSWVFDINYPYTFKLLQERNYLSSLGSLLPQDPKILQLIDHVNRFVSSKIT